MACENCPSIREANGAKIAAERQFKDGLIDKTGKKVAEILIGRRIIAVEETSRIYDCPGANKDEDGIDTCPLPWGRIDFLVNTNVEGHVQSAHQIATADHEFGFSDS